MLEELEWGASRVWSDAVVDLEANEAACELYREMVRRTVHDPELAESLSPRGFPIGCKRTLVSDDYYPALVRDNVTLETRAIDRIEPGGVRLADDTLVELDTIVWATGFETHGFVAPIAVNGPDGSLAQAWANGASAYRGTTIAGFPNLFLLYGPNTNLGHNSIIFMVERQMEYALPAILKVARGEARRIAIRHGDGRKVDVARLAIRASDGPGERVDAPMPPHVLQKHIELDCAPAEEIAKGPAHGVRGERDCGQPQKRFVRPQDVALIVGQQHAFGRVAHQRIQPEPWFPVQIALRLRLGYAHHDEL